MPTIGTVVRQCDYYGGMLAVECDEPNYLGRPFAITIAWYAFGDHGSARIQLDGPAEARKLADALIKAADALATSTIDIANAGKPGQP